MLTITPLPAPSSEAFHTAHHKLVMKQCDRGIARAAEVPSRKADFSWPNIGKLSWTHPDLVFFFLPNKGLYYHHHHHGEILAYFPAGFSKFTSLYLHIFRKLVGRAVSFKNGTSEKNFVYMLRNFSLRILLVAVDSKIFKMLPCYKKNGKMRKEKGTFRRHFKNLFINFLKISANRHYITLF